MKKIISILSISCIMLSLSTFSLGIYAGAAEDNNAKLNALLSDIGVYAEYDHMDYENETMMREEMASILSVFFGINEESVSIDTNIYDVSSYWASGHIQNMIDNGVMSCYEDGLFRPKLNVTLEQAVAAMIQLTGYKEIAQLEGGYPNGYFMVAAQLGITKNVSVANRKADITKGEFTQLLYNTLSVPVMRVKSISDRVKYDSDDDKNLLSENLNIYQARGIVTSIPYTALGYSDGVGTDRVQVGNIMYLCYKDAYPYLGEEVKIYYRQEKSEIMGEILHFAQARKESNVLTVNGEDIVSATLKSLSYEDGNKERKVDLADDLMVIFNGKRMTYFTPAHLTPKQGSVRLIDLDENDKYEYVIVNYEVNYHINTITTEKDGIYITEKNGKNAIKLDEDDIYSIFDAGKKISIDDLRDGDILSIRADKTNLETAEVLKESAVYVMHRSKGFLQGQLTEIDDENIYIDEIPYEKALDFELAVTSLTVGSEYTFYLNYLNQVIAADEGKAEYKYGILQAADKIGGLSEGLVLRIFTQEGDFIELAVTDNLKIDGYSKKSYNNALTYLAGVSSEYYPASAAEGSPIKASQFSIPEGGVWQLIRFIATDTEILQIDTLRANKTYSEEDLSLAYRNNNSSQNYSYRGKTFNGRYGMEQDAIIFEIGKDITKTENYQTYPLSHTYYYTNPMDYYDADELNICEVGVICNPSPSSIGENNTDKMMIVEKLSTKINKDGDAATYIKGTAVDGGSAMELELVSEAVYKNSGIKLGDIIRASSGTNGAISVLQKTFSPDGTGIYGKTEDPGSPGRFGWQLRIAYGTAMAKDDNWLKVKYEAKDSMGAVIEDKSFEEPLVLTELENVFVYDSAIERLSRISVEEIRMAKYYGEASADKVFIFTNEGATRTIVAYR